MRHPPADADLLVRLYMGAVLPSVAELVRYDDEARAAAGVAPWAVELRSASGISTTLAFDGQAVSTVDDPNSSGSPRLVLRFLNDAQLIRTFTNAGATLPPLPVGGFTRLRWSWPFSRVTNRLSYAMDAAAGDPDTRARVLFGGLLARALAVLCTWQASSGTMVARFGRFTAALVVDGEVRSWFAHGTDGFTAASGNPLSPPTVTLRFADIATAGQAADGSLDQLAAVGGGELKVDGLVPLADCLDVLLDRIARYLT